MPLPPPFPTTQPTTDNQPTLPPPFPSAGGSAAPQTSATSQQPLLALDGTAKPVLPYLAEGFDANGQPFYGDGLQGTIKKIFGEVFNPDNYSNQPSDPKTVDQIAKLIETKTNWDEWGKQYTGVSSADLGQAYTSFMTVPEGGNPLGTLVSHTATMLEKNAKSMAWNTILPALNWMETARRTSMAMDIAQHKTAVDAGISDSVTVVDNNPLSGALRNIGNAFDSWGINPVHNFQRLLENIKVDYGIITGKVDINTAAANQRELLNGSAAVATLYHNDTLLAKFDEQYKSGTPAGLLAQNMQDMGKELTFSLVDPSWIFGAKIPNLAKFGEGTIFFGKIKWFGTLVEIPTVGELIGLGSKVRQVAAAERLFVSAENIARSVGDIGHIGTNADAAVRMIETIKATQSAVMEEVKVQKAGAGIWNTIKDFMVSPLASGKASLLGRDFKNLLNGMIAAAPRGDVNEILAVMSDMQKAVKNNDVEAMTRVIQHPLASSMLSSVGQRSIALLNEISKDGSILDKLDKVRGNPAEFQKLFFSLADKASGELVPSVEEMYKAWDKAKKAGTPLEGIAKQYEELPSYIKNIQGIANTYDNTIEKWQHSYMGSVFLSGRPAFPAKNATGNFFFLMTDVGLLPAIEITAKAVTSSFADIGGQVLNKLGVRGVEVDKYVNSIIDGVKLNFDKMGLPIPEAVGRGVGGGQGVTSKLFAYTSQQIERVASSLAAEKKAVSEMQKVYSAIIPDVTKLTGSAEEQKLLIKFLYDKLGDVNSGIEAYRTARGAGSIEAQTLVKMPPKLEQFFRDSRVYDKLTELQNTAKSQVEFGAGMNKILDELYTKAASMTTLEPHGLSPTTPSEVVKISQDLAKAAQDGIIGDHVMNNFDHLVVAYQGAADAVKSSVMKAILAINPMLSPADNAALADGWSAVTSKFDNTKPFYNQIRHLIIDSIDKARNGEDIGKIWDNMNYVFGNMKLADQPFEMNFAKLYPDINQNAISSQKYVSLAYNALENIGTNLFYEANTSYYKDLMSLVDTFAPKAGTSLDKLASIPKGGMAGLFEESARKFQEAQALYAEMNKFKKVEAEIQSIGKVATEVAKPAEAVVGAVKPAVAEAVSLSDANINFGNFFTKSKDEIFNLVNAQRLAEGKDAYSVMSDVPKSEWTKALINNENRLAQLPRPSIGIVSPQRAIYENLKTGAYQRDLSSWSEGVKNAWGQTLQTTRLTPEDEKMLEQVKQVMDYRLKPLRSTISGIITAHRDFMLHDYNKTGLEKMIAYISPFSYWTLESGAKTLERSLDNPKIMNAYMTYRRYLTEQANPNLPDYMRFNLPVTNMLGFDSEHPLMLNLENSFSPIQNLMGQDFTDPRRNVDWLSSTVSAINNTGLSTGTFINWAIAAELYKKGMNDAGNLWMGRFLPQTQQARGLLTAAGLDLNAGKLIQHNELDPIVNLLDGGLTQSDKINVTRALAWMQTHEHIPQEVLIDAARQRGDNPYWQEALRRAVTDKLPEQMASFFTGLNMRSISEQDKVNYQFGNDFGQVLALNGVTSPQDYKRAMDELRIKYPDMDLLLMAYKNDKFIDSAYAYSVLGRLPPSSTDVLLAAGLHTDDINRFYNSKGDMTKWTESQRTTFMSAVLSLGAVLTVPTNATRESWTEAKIAYSGMRDYIDKRLGAHTMEQVDAWYQLHYSSDTNDQQKASEMLANNPVIQQALTMKTAIIYNTPQLMQYYGSVNTIRSYYTSKAYADMKTNYGIDMGEFFAQYSALKPNNVATPNSKLFYKQNKTIFDAFYKYQDENNRIIASIGLFLPARVPTRIDLKNPDMKQQDIINALNPQVATHTKQEFQQILGDPMMSLLTDYYTKGVPLSYEARSILDATWEKAGFTSYTDMLQQIGVALYQP